MARVTIYRPSPVRLAPFGAHRPLPFVLAGHPLAARFDSDTLFFDVFSVSRDAVLCIGPPLDTVTPHLEISVHAAGRTMASRTQRHRIVQQYSTRTLVTGSGIGMEGEIEIAANGARQRAAVNADVSALLAGRRVVVTVSKDNPLAWIRDWAVFYAREHGADAILLYDNGSGGYGVDDIGAALADIEGLAEVVVVDWPFPYGVGAPAPGQPAPDNFCQTVALDHARRCFCRRSRAVLSLDVDELVLADGGSIFARVESSGRAALLFHGVWAETPGVGDAAAMRAVRHRDCVFSWREQLEALGERRLAPLGRSKWVCVPARCAEHMEWGVHEVYAATRWGRFTRRWWLRREDAIAYRHCRQINTGWKIERWRSSEDFALRCVLDAQMARAMERVFGGGGAQGRDQARGP